jgi:hypothetical protein
MDKTDAIMHLAREAQDAARAHAVAVHEYVNDRAAYDPIPALAAAWTAAEAALREAVAEAIYGNGE